MFRFSIRELLLLTLVVGLGFGWWIDRSQRRTELHQAQAWRTRAGALEEFLKGLDWQVYWDFKGKNVLVDWQPPKTIGLDRYRHGRCNLDTDSIEPSGDRPNRLVPPPASSSAGAKATDGWADIE